MASVKLQMKEFVRRAYSNRPNKVYVKTDGSTSGRLKQFECLHFTKSQ